MGIPPQTQTSKPVVIQQALKQGDIDPRTISYIEAAAAWI